MLLGTGISRPADIMGAGELAADAACRDLENGHEAGRSRRCGGTTMPWAATTTGPPRRSTWTGTASDAAPGDISSDVRA